MSIIYLIIFIIIIVLFLIYYYYKIKEERIIYNKKYNNIKNNNKIIFDLFLNDIKNNKNKNILFNNFELIKEKNNLNINDLNNIKENIISNNRTLNNIKENIIIINDEINDINNNYLTIINNLKTELNSIIDDFNIIFDLFKNNFKSIELNKNNIENIINEIEEKTNNINFINFEEQISLIKENKIDNKQLIDDELIINDLLSEKEYNLNDFKNNNVILININLNIDLINNNINNLNILLNDFISNKLEKFKEYDIEQKQLINNLDLNKLSDIDYNIKINNILILLNNLTDNIIELSININKNYENLREQLINNSNNINIKEELNNSIENIKNSIINNNSNLLMLNNNYSNYYSKYQFNNQELLKIKDGLLLNTYSLSQTKIEIDKLKNNKLSELIYNNEKTNLINLININKTSLDNQIKSYNDVLKPKTTSITNNINNMKTDKTNVSLYTIDNQNLNNLIKNNETDYNNINNNYLNNFKNKFNTFININDISTIKTTKLDKSFFTIDNNKITSLLSKISTDYNEADNKYKTNVNLVNSLKTTLIPIPKDFIIAYAGDFPVSGWEELTGSSLSNPNLKERIIIGRNSNPNLPGLSLYQKGDLGGEEKHLLTIDEIPSHYHNTMKNINNACSFIDNGPSSTTVPWYVKQSFTSTKTYINKLQLNNTSSTSKTPSNNINEGHENMMPYVALHYLKKI